ncbi:MAG TPA: YbhB/YbcL family Raf kinase inhibitor-like protein [Terriglobales bacterium]|nr:YbhB/YbcL family Raf kinase inhibitor-like protein [Terriglobales bacterium]
MNHTIVRTVVLTIAGYTVIISTLLAQTAPETGKVMTLQISAISFPAVGTIPKTFTCDGQDVSPLLRWTEAPSSTKAFALIADDPDAPAGTWTHWLMWNIPPSTHELHEGISKNAQLPDGARQGQNDFKKIGYNGPCPPPGKPHRYYFKLFALDAPLEVKSGASRAQLEDAIQQHTLAHAEVMGRYGR